MVKQKIPKGRVPVASRERESEAPAKPRKAYRLGPLGLVSTGLVILFVLAALAVPLRNYYNQRSEIARIEASIQDKQAEIERLNLDLDKYQSDAYIREQARRRLGVIEPGETAYRIVDPSLEDNAGISKAPDRAEQTGPWYDLLWRSVTVPALTQPEPDEEIVDDSGSTE